MKNSILENVTRSALQDFLLTELTTTPDSLNIFLNSQRKKRGPISQQLGSKNANMYQFYFFFSS